ncbi:aldehyde dehydrogenase family protein [Micromonospora tulbaghiae]|uniref:aldehyde dehydrogenase family protein n=1 Tax=Micromonospora tulbaghiae TaxID=479978 RepID=UPI00197B6846|nr:aldehyde dehydrogenase family protein [Micromonospora tulbaghiae]
MTRAATPTRLPALGPAGPYRGTRIETVPDVTGAVVAELSLVPWLFAQRAVRALRWAAPRPPGERAALLAEAGRIFAEGEVDGVGVDEHCRTVASVAGTPISVVRDVVGMVAQHAATAYDSARQARPIGTADSWRDDRARHGCGVWTRRGEVLAVHAPANSAAVHTAWIDALALGYRVALRPSQREPFTSYRLVSALRQAGYGGDQAALLPTDHPTADRLVAEADLALAFGSDGVVGNYGAGTRVLPFGPGRSKVLITAGTDPAAHLDTIVESVAGQAGTGCVNATAVFVEGDATPVAEAIAARLAQIPSMPPGDERARLPVSPAGAARAVQEHLAGRVGGARALDGAPAVDDLGDGSAVLRPAVFLLDRADAPQARIEMGFPCVWVAPWHRERDGTASLRHTLSLTVLTGGADPAADLDADLIDAMVAEPTIDKVHVGDHPTTWTRPGMPHEGYLGDFLMRSKAVIVG